MMNNTFVDTRLEWKGLSGLTSQKYDSYVSRTPDMFFTQERVQVLNAIKSAHSTYGYTEEGTLSRESIEAMLGRYPAELDVPVNVDFVPIYDQLENLSIKRELYRKGQELIRISETAVPDIDQVATLFEEMPHTSVLDPDLDSGAQNYLDVFGRKYDNTYTYLNTGLPDLDMSLGGEWPRASCTVLGGLPGAGKSIFALNCMLNAAQEYGTSSALMAYEMTKEAHINRAVSKLTMLPKDDLTVGAVSKEEKQLVEHTVNHIRNLPIKILESRKLGLTGLLSAMRTLRVKHGVEVFYIDHLQLVPVPNGEGRNEGLGTITQALDQFGKAQNCSVVLLTQLTIKNGTVVVRDSGNVESAVETFMYLSTDSQESTRTVTMHFNKNREGQLIDCPFIFYGAFQTFLGTQQVKEIGKINGRIEQLRAQRRV
jgi:replicative DNA helicase